MAEMQTATPTALIVRLTSAAVYLAGTAAWALATGVFAALGCDDACGAPPYRDWRENPDAWQYGVIGWMGVAGLAIAIVAVIASWFRRRLGIAAFCVHASLFVANGVVLVDGVTHRTVPALFVFAVLSVAVAGALAVSGRTRRHPRRAAPTAP